MRSLAIACIATLASAVKLQDDISTTTLTNGFEDDETTTTTTGLQEGWDTLDQGFDWLEIIEHISNFSTSFFDSELWKKEVARAYHSDTHIDVEGLLTDLILGSGITDLDDFVPMLEKVQNFETLDDAIMAMRLMVEERDRIGSGSDMKWENWIGKYRYENATYEFISAMYDADYDKDGDVNFAELVRALISSGSPKTEMLQETLEELGPDHNWETDSRILFELMPDAWDHDHDGYLTKDEVESFYDFLGTPEAAEGQFDSDAVIATSSLGLGVEMARFGGDQVGDQFYGMSSSAKDLLGMDANDDSIVSLREFLTAVEYDLTYDDGDSAIDVEGYISEYGEDYNWLQSGWLIADILSAGVNRDSYHSVYDRCEIIGRPWFADTIFGEVDYEVDEATIDQFEEVAEIIFWTEDQMDAPEGWIPREEREILDYGWTPSEEMMLDRNQELVESVIEGLMDILGEDDPEEMEIDSEFFRRIEEMYVALERYRVAMD